MNGTELILHPGDCLDILDKLPANHFDAVITDPPYHLKSIVKRFGSDGAAPAKVGKDGASKRMSRRFEGKTWDAGEVAFQSETWAKVMRVMKPGAFLAAFNHARQFHKMAMALETAGFEYRETIYWVYGSGLPQNHPQDKALRRLQKGGMPITDEQIETWIGWGTVLKPAVEPIALVRKPLSEGSIARQCVATGTGAININRTKVPNYDDLEKPDSDRYPSNLVHDGSPEVWSRFPMRAGMSASRFFYCAKAKASDRKGSDHATVKPQELMRWLLLLVCSPGSQVLDPFAGSGSTLWAAHSLGLHCEGIERDEAHQQDIRRNIEEISALPPVSAQDDQGKPRQSSFLEMMWEGVEQ